MTARVYHFWPPGARSASFIINPPPRGDPSDAAADACREVLKWLGGQSFSVVKQPVKEDYWFAEFSVDGERLRFWVISKESTDEKIEVLEFQTKIVLAEREAAASAGGGVDPRDDGARGGVGR